MKILCAVDGSEFSKWAVEALGALAEQVLHSAILIHVAGPGRTRSSAAKRAGPVRPRSPADKAGAALLKRAARTATLALGQSVTAPRTTIETVLAQGSPGELVVREAERRRVDLVVVGSRGLSDLRGFLLGSVSRTVMALARRPVLVVKQPLRKLERVVLAVDGSAHSRAVVRFLCRGLIPSSAHLTIISVVKPAVGNLAARTLHLHEEEPSATPEKEAARRLVSTYRDTLLGEDFSVRAEVVEGHPGQAILDYVERHPADLIIVGARGETRTRGLSLGSVSERVVQQAPCSVLVVRGARH